MRFGRHNQWLVVALVATIGSMVACGPSPEEVEASALTEAWVAVESAKSALDEKRSDLAALEAQAAETVEAEVDEAVEEIEETVADAGAQITTLRSEVESASEDLGLQLVDFINNSGMVEGEPPTELQLGALRMKSSEDILVAEDYIKKGGDYARAIDIYDAALSVDPDNEVLLAGLEHAREMRFMTEERFAIAKKGMTEEEVRGQLGEVNLRNVRDYSKEGRDVVAWFYPREDGGAAAVWFRKKGGIYKVYQLKYNEVEGAPSS